MSNETKEAIIKAQLQKRNEEIRMCTITAAAGMFEGGLTSSSIVIKMAEDFERYIKGGK